MRIAQVMGNVTLSQAHPTFARGRLRLVVPLTLEQASTGSQEDLATSEELLVAWDDLGAGQGTLVALAEGPEAAQPYYPELKPIDAAIVALLDSLSFSPAALEQLKQ